MQKWLSIILFLLVSLVLTAQEVTTDNIIKTADAFIRGYLGSRNHVISGIRALGTNSDREIYVIDLNPEGWLLMSGKYEALPVLAFSLTGNFMEPADTVYDNRSVFLSEYLMQLRQVSSEKSSYTDPRWDPDFYYRKSSVADNNEVTVSPIIKVTWNQGNGWNRFCPEDAAGPGGHVYAGCVAVSMAQAMSVYGFPSSGKGSKQYDHPVYGSIFADFGSATYDWSNMKPAIPDDNNALILYHCAVSVDMDFSPTGSGTVTIAATSTALKEFFNFSKKIAFLKRGTDTEAWKSLLDKNLLARKPIIYAGFPGTGSVGHAFNIDGVFKSNYYHLNWGWTGVNDGYYSIDQLKPGSSDFTKEHTAIFGIQPFYYPTGINLSDTLVFLGFPAGKAVAEFAVEDEATDNIYEIALECDSTLSGTQWIPDYYLDGDTLRTARLFERADGPVDTVTFIIKDAHGNTVRANRLLLLTASLHAGDGEPDESFTVYPVPATDHFVITLPPGTVRIRIADLRGVEVASLENESGRVTVSVSGMAPGIYIITLTDARGNKHSKTVVKN